MPRFPEVSPTSTSLSDKVFSQLVQRARTLHHPIAPLHVGDTYREPLLAARAESQLSVDTKGLHSYSPVEGEPLLLAAIERRLQKRAEVKVPRDRIQVMSGTTAGLNVIANTILNPGDEVLLPAPYWPLIRGIIAGRGAVPVQVPFHDRVTNASFDPERALEIRVTARTVALYVNTPNNPSGRVLDPHVIRAMLNVAKRHNLWVICDEAYDELWFTDEAPQPAWSYEEAEGRTIACHTFSKNYGLAGSRIGYAHGPLEMMRAIRGVQTFLTYCATKPMQLGAARALDHGDGWLEESRVLYRRAAEASAAALGVESPQGGTFLFFDAGPYLKPEDPTCLPFLERCLDAGVLLTPGSACGVDYSRWARLCFTSVPMEELESALEKLQTVVNPV